MSRCTTNSTKVIAEISGNHNGSKERFLDLVKLAKESGASMVKVQCFKPDTITANSDQSCFFVQDGPWSGSSLHDLYSETYTPWDWYDDLYVLGERLDIEIFASVFDEHSADFISQYNSRRVKIASPEIIDERLISYCSTKFNELIISTGMASKKEIENAASIVKQSSRQLTLLQCVSEYPAEPSSYNLNGLKYLSGIADCVGVSDHSLDDTVVLGSIALGAKVVEKHFTDLRSIGGIDSHFSLEPSEFKTMVRKIRDLEQALCSLDYEEQNYDANNRKYRRSLFFSSDLKKGRILKAADVKCIRPGVGLHPSKLNEIIGMKVKQDVRANDPVEMEMFEDL